MRKPQFRKISREEYRIIDGRKSNVYPSRSQARRAYRALLREIKKESRHD